MQLKQSSSPDANDGMEHLLPCRVPARFLKESGRRHGLFQSNPCLLEAMLFFVFVSIFTTSCTHPNRNMRNKLVANEVTKSLASVDWEPKPRAIAEGSSAQLVLRASEGINMLYAMHTVTGNQDLFFANSHDMGDSFSKPIRVNTEDGELGAHGENDPQLLTGNGSQIYALWEGNQDIKFSRSVNFGKSFSSPLRVNDNEQKSYRSFFTMGVASDGAVYAAWLDGRDRDHNAPGTSSLYIAKSSDQGASFGKNIRIAGNICPCCHPALAFGNNGEVFITWRHVYADDERIVVVASSLDGGETWSDPVRVTEKGWKINGCPHSGPTLGYIDGKLIVTWYTAEDGKAVLRAARSTDGGQTFEVFQSISAGVFDATHPHMAIIQNEAWIIFQGRDPDTGGGWNPARPWLVRIPSDGAPTLPEPLPSSGENVIYPRIFPGTGGRIYTIWTEIDEKGPKLILCRGRIRQ